MKKINFLLLGFLFALIIGLTTSCSDDEGGDPVTTDPLKITVTEEDGATHYPGSDVVFTVNVTSSEKMQDVVVTPTNNGTPGAPQTFDLGNEKGSKTLSFTFSIPADAAMGSTIALEFVATDKQESKAASVSFVVSAPTTEVAGGVVYHILGASQGAWDLVTNTGVSEGGSANRYLGENKDMINREPVAGKTAFLAEIVAGNETRFVKNNEFDYANATLEAALAAFAAGEPHGKGQTSMDPGDGSLYNTHDPVAVATGDIFIAKIRGTEDYAVINITNVSGTSSADGKIEFTYKKKDPSYAKKAGKGTPMKYF